MDGAHHADRIHERYVDHFRGNQTERACGDTISVSRLFRIVRRPSTTHCFGPTNSATRPGSKWPHRNASSFSQPRMDAAANYQRALLQVPGRVTLRRTIRRATVEASVSVSRVTYRGERFRIFVHSTRRC